MRADLRTDSQPQNTTAEKQIAFLFPFLVFPPHCLCKVAAPLPGTQMNQRKEADDACLRFPDLNHSITAETNAPLVGSSRKSSPASVAACLRSWRHLLEGSTGRSLDRPGANDAARMQYFTLVFKLQHYFSIPMFTRGMSLSTTQSSRSLHHSCSRDEKANRMGLWSRRVNGNKGIQVAIPS